MFCYVMKDACGSGKSRVAAVFLRQGDRAAFHPERVLIAVAVEPRKDISAHFLVT